MNLVAHARCPLSQPSGWRARCGREPRGLSTHSWAGAGPGGPCLVACLHPCVLSEASSHRLGPAPLQTLLSQMLLYVHTRRHSFCLLNQELRFFSDIPRTKDFVTSVLKNTKPSLKSFGFFPHLGYGGSRGGEPGHTTISSRPRFQFLWVTPRQGWLDHAVVLI